MASEKIEPIIVVALIVHHTPALTMYKGTLWVNTENLLFWKLKSDFFWNVTVCCWLMQFPIFWRTVVCSSSGSSNLHRLLDPEDDDSMKWIFSSTAVRTWNLGSWELLHPQSWNQVIPLNRTSVESISPTSWRYQFTQFGLASQSVL
jgi:hypothetical protein